MTKGYSDAHFKDHINRGLKMDSMRSLEAKIKHFVKRVV